VEMKEKPASIDSFLNKTYWACSMVTDHLRLQWFFWNTDCHEQTRHRTRLWECKGTDTKRGHCHARW
jgi:hypothetical protein